VYTDGSTAGDQTNGGAGIFIQDREGQTLLEESKPAGALCSSYDAECVALESATDWISGHQTNSAATSYAIFTDSKSLMSSLESNDWRDKHGVLNACKLNLAKIKKKLTICWVPSHCGTFGNEKADWLASKGTELQQKDTPVSYSIARAKIRSEKWEIKHERAKETFKHRRKPKSDIESKWPPEVRRTYARLRSGHAKELRDYLCFIQADEDATCKECGLEDETIEHVICRCPALDRKRRETTQRNWTIDMLVEQPELCRRILEERIKKLAIRDQAKETHEVPRSGEQPSGLQGDIGL
jgi:ribonuclease HI